MFFLEKKNCLPDKQELCFKKKKKHFPFFFEENLFFGNFFSKHFFQNFKKFSAHTKFVESFQKKTFFFPKKKGKCFF